MPYDQESAAIVGRLRGEIEVLGLPLLVARRLLGVVNAIEMNVEEGRPNQETVNFLFQALTAEAKSLPESSRKGALAAINRCTAALGRAIPSAPAVGCRAGRRGASARGR